MALKRGTFVPNRGGGRIRLHDGSGDEGVAEPRLRKRVSAASRAFEPADRTLLVALAVLALKVPKSKRRLGRRVL